MFATYNDLLDSGWRMTDIDGMDMIGFLHLRAWRAAREQRKAVPKRRYIDEIWPKPR